MTMSMSTKPRPTDSRRVYPPTVLPLAEGGYLVKHTDDVDKARWLVQKWVARDQYGDDFKQHLTPAQVREISVGKARPIYCRITPCLPSSYGAREGWAWSYHCTDGPGKGVVKAVEFLV
jgi:hypothetical protein